MVYSKQSGWLLGAVSAAWVAFVAPSQASLVTFQTVTGHVGLSTDGYGDVSLGGTGIISASVPSGATVVAAYLYSATYDPTLINNGDVSAPEAVTLNGVEFFYDASFANATACCSLASHRADVTSIVAPVINGGAGGVYDFTIAENGDNTRTDGSALVVVYDLPSLPVSTVGILNGSAEVTGDTTSIAFSAPLDPNAAGFQAEMYLGIGFSCCVTQQSDVDVNGLPLTDNAGNHDDGLDLANGSLITVGSFDDPFSPANPSYDDDREKYDLSSLIALGDTLITVNTFNSSADDNIFLAAFLVSGEASITPNPVPVPPTILLLGSSLAVAGIGGARRRRWKARKSV